MKVQIPLKIKISFYCSGKSTTINIFAGSKMHLTKRGNISHFEPKEITNKCSSSKSETKYRTPVPIDIIA
jgi:hypothetical protein